MSLKVGLSVLAVLVVINLALVYSLQYTNKKLKLSEKALALVKDEVERNRLSYESTISTLLSERASERAATADMIDSLRKIQESKQTIIQTINEIERNDEEIKDYLDVAIPNDLAILLENPLALDSNRVCDSDSTPTPHSTMHSTKIEENANN